MLSKIYKQVVQIFEGEGYTVNPEQADLAKVDTLPVLVIAFPEDETETALEPEDQENSRLLNECGFYLRIAVSSTYKDYREKCLEELSNVKRILEAYRQIKDDEGCELARKWVYDGFTLVNFQEMRYASGGIEVRTFITYSQLRTDPTNN